MMKAYIDSDVILDVTFNRKNFSQDSTQILTLCETGALEGYTTTLALANLFYILERHSKFKAKTFLRDIRKILGVLAISDEEIQISLDSKFKDFEDGVQNAAAEKANCRFIVTRNLKDFKYSRLEVVAPREFLKNT